jgi:hypothetical protein
LSFELVRDFRYDLGEAYSGDAVETTFEFSTPAGPVAQTVANGIIAGLQDKCVSEGSGRECLRTQVWVDYSPAVTTNWMVTFSIYDPTQHSPVGPATIAFIQWLVGAVLVAVVVFLIYQSIRTIRDIFYSPAGPELGSAVKWVAIAVAIFAGAMLTREIVKGRSPEKK